MGSNMNFNNNIPIGGGDGKAPSNLTLMRQPSIYSLTFDEFQSTIGGLGGKDFGSMNMDELLKNIWTAEETQSLATTSLANGEGGNNQNNNNNNNNGYSHHNNPNGNLQRQGSLTLPRTLSQKTVDEVWRDLLIKDSGGVGSNNNNGGTTSSTTSASSAMPQRQQTLGEMTLEEFLVRAGVVREDINMMPPQIGRPNNGIIINNNNNSNNQWFNNNNNNNNNTGLVLGFQHHHPNGNLGNNNNNNRMVNLNGSNNPVSKQPPTLSLQVNPNPNSTQHQQQQQQQSHQHHQPPLFPKPTNVAFAAAPMQLLNNTHMAGAAGGGGGRGGVIGVGMAAGGGSPASQISPEVMRKGTVDTSSVSPVPYVINRGRKCSAIEKVVERRQRRMIKNRESAARSRARKQAYTLELEAEVQKLQDINKELERKQAELMEMQKNQDVDTVSRLWGGKRQCLRRTLTGPW